MLSIVPCGSQILQSVQFRMADYRITLKGFTLKEANELEERVQAIDGIESTAVRLKFLDAAADPSGSPMASLSDINIVINLVKHSPVTSSAVSLLGIAAVKTAGRVGETIGDILSMWIRGLLTHKSVVEVEVSLLGPDGKLVKRVKGRR